MLQCTGIIKELYDAVVLKWSDLSECSVHLLLRTCFLALVQLCSRGLNDKTARPFQVLFFILQMDVCLCGEGGVM